MTDAYDDGSSLRIPPRQTLEEFEAEVVPLLGPAPNAPRAVYPLDALGDVLGPAARAIAARVQCAPEMAAQSVLGVASLAAQAVADVRLPYEQVRPLSLFVVTVAQSGDRKSSADNEAMAPVRIREQVLKEQYDVARADYDIADAAWRAQHGQIERSKQGTFQSRKADLKALGPAPVAPLKPALTINESTAEGLAKNWPHLRPALGIFSAEGGQFLGGHGFTPEAKLRTAAALSSLWDGADLRRVRASDGLVDLHGRRLAAHLMLQPEAANGVLADGVLRDQGFLSRLLIAAPETLAGTRLWREPKEGVEAALGRYIAATMSVFEQAAENDELSPRPLELTPKAREVWIAYHNEVETAQGAGREYAALRDVAGKAAEQAARIAGVLAIVEDADTDSISGPIMRRACELGRWYLKEALRLATAAKQQPVRKDAAELRDWIEARSLKAITATELQQQGPNRLRGKEKLYPAIGLLVVDGFLVAKGNKGPWVIASN